VLPYAKNITVDMIKLSAPVTARWYDPPTAHTLRSPARPFANTGTRQFTPTGNNSEGDGDDTGGWRPSRRTSFLPWLNVRLTLAGQEA